jgi:hypothetical protein
MVESRPRVGIVRPLDRIEERFEHDASFHALVTVLEAAVLNLELSASELREAAMYAAYRVEMRRPIPPIVSGESFEDWMQRRVGRPYR